MIKKFNYFAFFLIFITSTMFLSCEEEGIETFDKAEYELHLRMSDGSIKSLIGENNIDSNWDPETGLLWLGTDAINEPLGTLTMNINNPNSSDPLVGNAILSTTDVKKGNGSQINGKLYESLATSLGVCQRINVKEIGVNYIYVDDMCFQMWNEQDDELITLEGWFIAKSK